MKLNKTQISVLIGIVVLSTVLFMLPKKVLTTKQSGASRDKPQTESSETTQENLKTIESIITESIAKLTETEKQELLLAENADATAITKVMQAYKKFDNKLGIAFCIEKLKEPNSERVIGLAYYAAFNQSVLDENRSAIAAKAITFLKPSLEKSPDDVVLKCALADCYVNTAPNPMSGIMLLREVIAKDSINENALFLLGEFAIKSKQMDKALLRFESLVRNYPSNIKYSLYLAQLFSNEGASNKALETLVSAKKYASRKTAIDSITNSINHLK